MRTVRTHETFAARGVELMVMLPLPIEQCHAVVESLGLTYPLYADPTWSVFQQYTNGHIFYAPEQSWVGVDADRTVSCA